MRQAVGQADTELLLFLDDGDVLHDDVLDFLVSLVWDVDVCYPTVIQLDPDCEEIRPKDQTRINGQIQSYPYGNAYQAHPFCPNRLKLCDYVSGGTLVRKTAYQEVGGHRSEPEAVHGGLGDEADHDLWLRLSLSGHRFKHVPEAVVLSRHVKRKETSLTGSDKFKACFYHQATFATAYWRCLVPARQLPGVALDFPHVLNNGTKEKPVLGFPEQTGAAIFQFPGDRGRATLMHAMQKQGVKVLVEVDDNYLASSPQNNPGWVKGMTDSGAHSLEAHERMLPWVDGVIVTTEQLAKIYRKKNPNVFICPNSVDPADWPVPQKPPDGKLRIGWFASGSHTQDAKLIERGLRWACQQDGVEVVTMGLAPTWWKGVRFTNIPWTNDLGVYRKMIGTLDIGLCPVMPTPWSVCRSDLKATEYAMGGAVPVMSDVSPYNTWVNGVGCMKVGTPKEWLHAIKWLVQNPDDAKALARQAKEFVMERRAIAKTIHCWEEAIS